jgi:hypothetical protein
MEDKRDVRGSAGEQRFEIIALAAATTRAAKTSNYHERAPATARLSQFLQF